MLEFTWQINKYPENIVTIKSILNNMYADNDALPANNRWEYLLPLIDQFYSNQDVLFVTLIRGEKKVLCIPMIKTIQPKFFYKWKEIGFPFHKHINLISLGNGISENELCSLLSTLKQHFIRWDRFSIRHIIDTRDFISRDSRLTEGVAFFNTSSNFLISEVISKKHLRNIRRYEKKIKMQYGNISYECNENNLILALKEFCDLELSGWKGEAGVAIKSCNKLSNMYQNIAHNFGPETLKIYNIRSEHHLLASALGFKLGETLYIHKVSFNPKYIIFSPGNILLLKIIEESIKSDMTSTVNLVTYPDWAKRWHPNKTHTHNIVIYNKTPKGQFLKLLIVSWRKTKPLIKKMIKNLKTNTYNE